MQQVFGKYAVIFPIGKMRLVLGRIINLVNYIYYCTRPPKAFHKPIAYVRILREKSSEKRNGTISTYEAKIIINRYHYLGNLRTLI